MFTIRVVFATIIFGLWADPLHCATNRAGVATQQNQENPNCVVDESIGFAGQVPTSLCRFEPVRCRCMCWQLDNNGDPSKLLDVVEYNAVECKERVYCYANPNGPNNCCSEITIPCNHAGLWEGDCDACGRASSNYRGVWSGCDKVIESGPNSEYP